MFATLTRPHTKTAPLVTGMDMIGGAWMAITASHQWRTIKQAYGIRHWARSLEITWNPRSGWHVHIHMLAFTDEPHTDCKAMQVDMLDLWNRQLERQGSRQAGKRHGVIVLPVTTTPARVGGYMSKPPDSIGSEITRMDNKTSRKHSIAPFQLLDPDTIDQLGASTAQRLWLEYVNATRGQRSITWSRKLRSELVSTIERTDQQIIDDTTHGTDVIDILASQYRQLKRSPSLMAYIMSRIETGEIPLAEDIINDIDNK